MARRPKKTVLDPDGNAPGNVSPPDDALFERVRKLCAGGSVSKAAEVLKAAAPSPSDYHRCIAVHPAMADAIANLGGIS